MVRGSWALSGYDAPLGRAVRAAKYGSDRQLTRHLGRVLGLRLLPAVDGAGFDAIVPVPTPWTRRVMRGFCPASVIANEVSRLTRTPVVQALRLRPGPRQAGLGAAERRKSLKGRLRSRRSLGGRVLLVDDVATTGATSEACARELLGDGVSEVWLAVLCQVRRPS